MFLLAPAHLVSPGQRAIKQLLLLLLLFSVNVTYVIFLQCFDTVGWAAGRASGL